MKKLITAWTLLAFLTFSTGCNSGNRVLSSGLKVELTGIEQSRDGTVQVSWVIVNTNVTPFLLSRVSHKIRVNGVNAGITLDEEPLGLPPGGTGGRTSQLVKGDPEAGKILAQAAAGGSVNYQIHTNLVVRIYDETVEKCELANSGRVSVIEK